MGFRKPHAPKNKRVWLQQQRQECGISSLSAKTRPNISYEQYYEYLFTYADLLDDLLLFQASSPTELEEEGSFTWNVNGFSSSLIKWDIPENKSGWYKQKSEKQL